MPQFSRTFIKKAAVVVCLAVAASAANAAPINYGDFSDIPPGSVMYLDVTESSFTDTVPLYGEPSINGNLLDFDPLAFGAFKASAGPNDITDGQLNFGFMTDIQDGGLTGISFSESGDYSLAGAGTTISSVSAGLAVRVTITEINGLTLGTPIVVADSTSVTFDLVTNPGISELWDLSLDIDFTGVLGQDEVVTKGEVVLNNTLIAIAEDNSVSFIAKKDFGITPEVVIPEPGSLALLGIGGLLMARRRRDA